MGKTINPTESQETYLGVYHYLQEKEHSEELADAVFQTIEDWDVFNDEYWDMLIWAINNTKNFYWGTFIRIIRKHISSDVEKAVNSVKVAICTQSEPSYLYLEKLLSVIAQYDKRLFYDSANLCIKKGWQQTMLTELISKMKNAHNDETKKNTVPESSVQ